MRFRLSGRILTILLISVVAAGLLGGCKPEGGGGVGGTVVNNAIGGPHPGYQTLIIDEASIRVENLGDSQATIYWETNFPATASVEYGELVSYTNTTTVESGYKLQHRRDLVNLKYGQTYHFRCISEDSWKNIAISKDHIFTTGPHNWPPKAVVLSDTVEVTYSTAKLSWTVNEDIDFKDYLIRYDQKEDVTVNSPLATTIPVKLQSDYTITDLQPETRYWFRVFTRDTLEVETGSNTVSATTAVNYLPPEAIGFEKPANVTPRSITLKWQRFNGPYFSSYRIFRSQTPNFKPGLTAEVTITLQDTVTWEDTGLTPATTYYYKIYVTNQGGYISVSPEQAWTTLALGENVTTIPNVYSPVHILPVKSEFWISSFSALQIFNPTENRIVYTIEAIGHNGRMARTADEEWVFVPAATHDELREFDVSQRRLTRKVAVGGLSRSAVLSRDETQLYVPSLALHQLHVIERERFRSAAILSTGLDPLHSAVAVNQSILAVATSGTTAVTLFRADTLENTGEVNVEHPPTLLVADPGGRIMYVVSSIDNTIGRLDLTTNTLVDTINVGAEPVDLILTNGGTGAFLCLRGENRVVRYDLPGFTERYSFATGKEPRSIALAPGGDFIYVVNYGDDSLTVHAVE